MRLCLSLVLSLAFAEDVPLGIVRGLFLTYEGTAAAGVVTVKLAKSDQPAYSCRSDGRTYIERDRQRIWWRDVNAGDSLELVTDRTHRLAQCYVRMVHVIGPQPAKYPTGHTQRATESFAPRGSLSYSGVVSKVESDPHPHRRLEGPAPAPRHSLHRQRRRRFARQARARPARLLKGRNQLGRRPRNLPGHLGRYLVAVPPLDLTSAASPGYSCTSRSISGHALAMRKCRPSAPGPGCPWVQSSRRAGSNPIPFCYPQTPARACLAR